MTKTSTTVFRRIGLLLALTCVTAGIVSAQTPAPRGGTQESLPTSVQQSSPTPVPPAAIPSPALNQGSQKAAPTGDKTNMEVALAALATLVAGALGFLASLLVEKRSWQRRKLEQVREAQLAKITSISRQLHSFNSILAKVEKQCIQPATASQSLSTEAGLLQAQGRAAILASIPSMDLILDEIEMMSVELMTLRAKKEVMTDLDAYLSKACDVVGQLKAAAQVGDAAKVCEAVSAIWRDADLGAAFKGFVGHALDGLSE